MAGKQALIRIEETNGEGGPHAASAVHRKSANRIINFSIVDEHHGKHHEHSSDEAHNPSGRHGITITTSRDAHQASEKSRIAG